MRTTAVIFSMLLAGSPVAAQTSPGPGNPETDPQTAPAETAPPSAAEGLPYLGAELNSEWRKEAERRINVIRKAPLEIIVQDGDGEPVKDASVSVRQQQHGFAFSTYVDPRMFYEAEEEEGAPSAEDRARYRQTLIELFGKLRLRPGTTENAAAAVRKWAAAHDIPLKQRGELEPGDAPAYFTSEFILSPADLSATIDRLAERHGRIRAFPYRFEARMGNEEERALQAMYTRDYITLMFSRPEVAEIGFDGFWEPAIPERGWALFETNWAPLPVAETYRELVRKRWWTDDTALTDANGRCTVSCFLGDYRVSVSVGARTRTLNATVGADGATLTVSMEEPSGKDAESE